VYQSLFAHLNLTCLSSSPISGSLSFKICQTWHPLHWNLNQEGRRSSLLSWLFWQFVAMPTKRQPPSKAGEDLPNSPICDSTVTKSLKQTLKEAFFRTLRRSAPNSPSDVGSGILRRGATNGAGFASRTTLSSIAEEIHYLPMIPNRFESRVDLPAARHSARQSLLPKTSLSQFNLNQVYLHPTTKSQRPTRQGVSPSISIASHHASVTTFGSLYELPSLSTLKLQDSQQTLKSLSSSSKHGVSRQKKVFPAKSNHVSWLQSPTASLPSLRGSPANAHDARYADNLSVTSLSDHFKSFCILDTSTPGYPVVATSREMRYIFELGENFFLNSCECDGKSMDLVTGQDANGDPITNLVLFTPLVIPGSGRNRFLLASLVDVTDFIKDAASLPALIPSSDSSTVSSLRTPRQQGRRRLEWAGYDHMLSADNLLGGCILPSDRDDIMFHAELPDDIWLNIAKEERRSTAKSRSNAKLKLSQSPAASHPSSTGSCVESIDELLEQFMGGLQELYSEFFLLGKSPLDDSYFEICNVSPILYASKEYINGHLSHNDHQRLADLSARLAQGSAFDIRVRWGERGVVKSMYCNPVYTRSDSISWLCFLVDGQTPLLW
jgi:hypothetical protein